MQMDAGLDTGPVLLERGDRHRVRRHRADAPRPARRARRASSSCARCPKPRAAARRTTRPRPTPRRSTSAKRASTGAEPAELIERKVRAFNPVPGAATAYGDIALKIWRARLVPRSHGRAGDVSAPPMRAASPSPAGDGRAQDHRAAARGRQTRRRGGFSRGLRGQDRASDSATALMVELQRLAAGVVGQRARRPQPRRRAARAVVARTHVDAAGARRRSRTSLRHAALPGRDRRGARARCSSRPLKDERAAPAPARRALSARAHARGAARGRRSRGARVRRAGPGAPRKDS